MKYRIYKKCCICGISEVGGVSWTLTGKSFRFVSFVRGEAKLCVPVRRVASRGWAFDLRKVLRGGPGVPWLGPSV